MSTLPRGPLRIFIEECSNGYVIHVHLGPFAQKQLIADTPEAVLRLLGKVMSEPIAQEGG